MRLKVFIIIFTVFSGIASSQDNSTIKKLEFCSKDYNEFAAFFYDDYLVFSGNLKNGTYMNFLGKYAIFKTRQESNGKWSEPEIFDLDLISNFNDGPAVFSDSILYLTSGNYSPADLGFKSTKNSKTGLFYRKRAGNRWEGKNIAFTHNRDSCFVGHSTFSPDRKKIFFAADFPGGFGGLDLYYSIRTGDKWSQPFNMGSQINTAGNEAFPYYHPDGILYFSSDNHNSVGGLDIFFSEIKDNVWTKPVTIGSPVNSSFNDFAVNVYQDNDAGLFSSDREGSFDIFTYQSTFPRFTNCYISGDINRCIHVYETGTDVPDSCVMIYEWDMGDGTVYTGNDFDYCYKTDGKFLITLNVTDKLTGTKSMNVASSYVTVKTDESLFFSLPQEEKTMKEITFTVAENHLKDFTSNKFYWDFGDGTILEGETVKHSYKIPGDYQVKLGVIKDSKSITESGKYCVYRKLSIKK